MPRSHSSKKSTPIVRNPPSSLTTSPTPTFPTGPSFGQSMKDGFGLGMGSAIAHRVVGSIFGAPTVNVTSSQPSVESPCDKERFAFESCMKTRSIDTFCGQEQHVYSECIRIGSSTSGQ